MSLKRVIIIHMERSTCLHYFYISNRSAILLILINKYQPSNVKSLDSKTTFGSSELRFVVDRNCLCSKLSMNTWSTLLAFQISFWPISGSSFCTTFCTTFSPVRLSFSLAVCTAWSSWSKQWAPLFFHCFEILLNTWALTELPEQSCKLSV